MVLWSVAVVINWQRSFTSLMFFISSRKYFKALGITGMCAGNRSTGAVKVSPSARESVWVSLSLSVCVCTRTDLCVTQSPPCCAAEAQLTQGVLEKS